MAHYDAGRYVVALMAYEQALRLDSGYVVAYQNRGMAYGALQHYDKALADYNQALQLDPEHVPAYFNRGIVYHILKHYDRAIADYDQVLRRDPEHAGAYRNRGHAYKELAIADYTQALARDHNDTVLREELEFLNGHRLSLRAVIMVIGGAVGLTVVSGGLTWLLFPRTLSPKPIPPKHAAWFDSGYRHKKSIIIDHRKVSGRSNLSDFQTLIVLLAGLPLNTTIKVLPQHSITFLVCSVDSMSRECKRELFGYLLDEVRIVSSRNSRCEERH